MRSLGLKNHRWWLIAGSLSLCGLLLTLPTIAESKKSASSVAAEREKYEQECATALQPVQKRYLTRLKALQKILRKKGDDAGVAEIDVELERLGAAGVQQLNYPIEGQWKVEYTDGAIRNYILDSQGNVKFVEGERMGRITHSGDDVLLDFNDNIVERLRWKTVLMVEHFRPKSTYGQAEPALTGFAYKVK
jgi:hypothetical protein